MNRASSNWREVKLRDVAEDVTVGHVGSMASEYRESGVIFLRSQNVVPHGFDLSDVRYISTEFHSKLQKSALRAGDVVTVRTGKPGATAVVPSGWDMANCSDLVITRPGPELDARWLSYFINSAASGFISSRLVGAVQQHFNVGAARDIDLLLPPLPEQCAIAEVLGALDDKIAANRRLANEAINLAGLLYDQETAGVDRIPLLDVLTPVLGATPARSKPEYWSEEVPWASVKDVTRAEAGTILDTEERISRTAVSETKAKPIAPYSVLLTARGTVGSIARITQETSFNQSCYGFEPGDLPPAVLYFSIKSATARISEFAYGSVFDSITMSTFKNFLIPDLDASATQSLEARISPLLQASEVALRESQLLSQIRDTLLPRLMSGELRVRDAEEVVSNAV
ncbi:restriction endonuclease subunit S [Rhodococcus pyridinivorans]